MIQPSPMSDLPPLKDVWTALGGEFPSRGKRAKAFWRDGNGFNVSLDLIKGVWFDWVENRGGGVVSLIQAVHSCSPKEAFRWLRQVFGFTGEGYKKPEPVDRRAIFWKKAKAKDLEQKKKKAFFGVMSGKPKHMAWELYSSQLFDVNSLTGMSLMQRFNQELLKRKEETMGMVSSQAKYEKFLEHETNRVLDVIAKRQEVDEQ